MPGGQAVILIRSQHEEAFVTQAMLSVDRARTRMPKMCIVISVLVWSVFIAICFTSWFYATNNSTSDLPGSNSSQVRDAELYARPGRRF
jgi:hypothetical protein